MLFYLFSPEELQRLFDRLGYEYGPDTVRKNVAYYDRRTSHGSTLSYRRLRRGPRGAGRRELLGSLPRSPEERRRRRSGRDDQGGDPRGRDGRHARPDPAQLHGHSGPRRGPSVRPQAAGADRRAVVLDAVPADPAAGDARRRPADARRSSRGRQPADQGRGRRSKFATSAPGTVTPSSCSRDRSVEQQLHS